MLDFNYVAANQCCHAPVTIKRTAFLQVPFRSSFTAEAWRSQYGDTDPAVELSPAACQGSTIDEHPV